MNRLSLALLAPVLAVAFALVFAPAAAAQFTMGLYMHYGSGCPGSNNSLGCVSANMTRPPDPNGSFARTQYALLIPAAPTTRLIQHVEFPLATRQSTAGVSVALCGRSSSGIPSQQVRGTTIQVNQVLQVRRWTLSPILVVNPNQDLFLVIDNTPDLVMPLAQPGSWITAYVNTAGWVSVHGAWQYNIVCAAGNGVPELTCAGGPAIGKSFSLLLEGARPNSLALLATGLQRTGVDLAPAGASGCTLLLAPLLVTSAQTSASGNLVVGVTVPAQFNLLGVRFTNQFAVADTTNALGLAFSNACEGWIGTF